MSSSIDNYLDKIIALIQEKLSKNSSLKFPCKYMTFHQAKSYCKDCEDFVCDKCIQKHDKYHKILNLEEIIKLFTSNINLYKDLSDGKFPKEEKPKKTEGTAEKIILDENIEKSFIEEIDNLINKLTCTKKKIMKFFDSRKNLLKKYNSEDNKIIYDDNLMQSILKQEKLEIKPLNIKEVKEIHDLIKFEKNNTKLFKEFFSFCNDLDYKNKDIINNNKYLTKLRKKDSMSIFERINLKTNELNLIMTDSFIHKINNFLSNVVPYLDNKIEQTQEIFKNVICAYLKIEDGEYMKEMEKTEIEDENKIIKEKIVEVPKEVIVEKKVEIKVPIKKLKFGEEELKIQSKEKINIFGIVKKKETKEVDENKKIEIKDEEKKEDNKEEKENSKEEKQEINQEENKEEDIEKVNKEEKNKEESEEDNEELEDQMIPNNINEQNKNKSKKSGLKRTSAIKTRSELDSYSVSVLSVKSIKDVYSGTYNESKAIFLIKDNKYLMESEEEIEETKKSCHSKLNNLNLEKAKEEEDFDLNKELSKFSWKERNMFELIYPVEDQKLICIFNPYINKIEQIEMEMSFKFPTNCALYFRLPYCFISGGTIIDEDGDLVETNSFYTLRRQGSKIFEKLLLPEMLEEKSNHCLFEIPYINSLCALGGKNSKDVEVFDLDQKNWKAYPQLNYSRENASCCVINDTYVYCFFGYDEENAEYLSSIEKYDLVYKAEWEVLNPYGNKTFMKKKMCGCVKYRKNFEEYIYIVGGINVLNKESKDCLAYDEKNNNIEKMGEMSLPYKSSFNSCSFITLPNGILYNLNSSSQLIQFDSSIKYFFGIREKDN